MSATGRVGVETHVEPSALKRYFYVLHKPFLNLVPARGTKRERLWKPKAMTIAAGIYCNNGVVIAADTQMSVENFQ
jgi:hypothetical protein